MKYYKLLSQANYSHSKLIASMDFGMWKYMFSTLQYQLTRQSLLGIFPYKMRSTPQLHINQAYILTNLTRSTPFAIGLPIMSRYVPICKTR